MCERSRENRLLNKNEKKNKKQRTKNEEQRTKNKERRTRNEITERDQEAMKTKIFVFDSCLCVCMCGCERGVRTEKRKRSDHRRD